MPIREKNEGREANGWKEEERRDSWNWADSWPLLGVWLMDAGGMIPITEPVVWVDKLWKGHLSSLL